MRVGRRPVYEDDEEPVYYIEPDKVKSEWRRRRKKRKRDLSLTS